VLGRVEPELRQRLVHRPVQPAADPPDPVDDPLDLEVEGGKDVVDPLEKPVDVVSLRGLRGHRFGVCHKFLLTSRYLWYSNST
jgi:hypothetical protein